ncbi:MAG: thermonuclease family protein [Salinibacter sp.]
MGRACCFAWLLLVGVGAAGGQSFTGTVEAVRDGDTMTVLRGSRTVTVQLHGLDAPELTQPYGKEAAAFLREQVAGRRIQVRVRDRDRFGRWVATVVRDGVDVNERLLRAGLAWYYWWYLDYTPDAARDQTLAHRARQAGRGLWAQTAPVPPWQWRDEGHAVSASQSGPTGLRYNTEGRPRDCEDFETQPQAQRFFEAALPSATEGLDADGDEVACERLPSE